MLILPLVWPRFFYLLQELINLFQIKHGQSISSVASRAPSASGTIAGDIADRSLSNYMPHMQGFQMKGTKITGCHISTTATTPDGKKANVDMYSASQFEKPDAPHSVVTASDGSQWYQMASGEGRGAFYDAPVFGGMDANQPQGAGVQNDAPGTAGNTDATENPTDQVTVCVFCRVNANTITARERTHSTAARGNM